MGSLRARIAPPALVILLGVLLMAPATRAPGADQPGVVTGPPRKPFPQHIDYRRGIAPTAMTQERMDAVVLRLWRSWRAAYVRTDGSPGAWVQFDRTDSTVSEAIGYGMVFAAYLGDRPLFDAFHRHFRAHPSRYAADLMAWKQTLRGRRMVDVAGRDSATDGDMDIAYALLLADRQWGSTGAIDYAGEARQVSRAVLRHDVNHRLWSLETGDWARGNDSRHTRSSDFMPAHLAAFAAADPAKATQWSKVQRTTRRIVREQLRRGSRETGLLPDFLVHRRNGWSPVPGRYLESRHDGDFNYNACRTPWRLTTAHLLLKSGYSRRQVRIQNRWWREAHAERPRRIRAGYFVRNGPNGRPFADYRDLAFTAPVAVNALAGRADGRRWANRTLRAITRRPDTTNYYSDSLRLMALLVISRNWWQP